MKLAITGTIGSGKSVVSDYLRSKGYYVFDCDKCNGELLAKDSYAYNQIKYLYPEVFNDEELDKSKLANLVFNNSLAKQKLESIMHPLILMKMIMEMEKHDLFIAEVPLLFEFNWDSLFDKTILVATDDDLVINRLIDKGYDLNSAKSRINSQMSLELKKKRANEIIYNNDSLDSLFEAVDQLLAKYVR